MIHFQQDSYPNSMGYYSDNASPSTLARIAVTYNIHVFPCILYEKLENIHDMFCILHEMGHHVNKHEYRHNHTITPAVFRDEINAWEYVFDCIKPEYFGAALDVALIYLRTYAIYLPNNVVATMKYAENQLLKHFQKRDNNTYDSLSKQMRDSSYIFVSIDEYREELFLSPNL